MERNGTHFTGKYGTAYIIYVSYQSHNNLMRRLIKRGATKISSECVVAGKLARVSYLVLK